jgi:hypothetical protein
LGASEACVTTGIMTIISMFYNRTEVGERIGWTFQCNGFAMIIAALVSFGVSHIDEKAKPARSVEITSSILTLALTIVFSHCQMALVYDFCCHLLIHFIDHVLDLVSGQPLHRSLLIC